MQLSTTKTQPHQVSQIMFNFFHITSLKAGLRGQKHWFCNVRKSQFPSIFLPYHPYNTAVLPMVALRSQYSSSTTCLIPTFQAQRTKEQRGRSYAQIRKATLLQKSSEDFNSKVTGQKHITWLSKAAGQK